MFLSLSGGLWTPDQLDAGDNLPLSDETLNMMGAYTPPSASYSPASASPGTSYSEHKPKTPPPDLPSLLLDSRIVYIGMPVSVLSSRWSNKSGYEKKNNQTPHTSFFV